MSSHSRRWPVWRSPSCARRPAARALRAKPTVAKPAAPRPPWSCPGSMRWCRAPLAEPSPCVRRGLSRPDQGSLESVTALFAHGYIESAMRETILAAVHSDYPLLGMQDVRLTDPGGQIPHLGPGRTTAHDCLYAGYSAAWVVRSAPPSGSRSGRIPQQGRVSDWVKTDQAGCWPGAEPPVHLSPQEATFGWPLAVSHPGAEASAVRTSPSFAAIPLSLLEFVHVVSDCLFLCTLGHDAKKHF